MMYSRLDRVKNWELLAVRTKYSSHRLVKLCRISKRQLERYFHALGKGCLHAWIRRVRLTRAATLLKQGKELKRVAAELHYRQYAHFAKDFKGYHGVTPSQFLHFQAESGMEKKPMFTGDSCVQGREKWPQINGNGKFHKSRN